MNDRAPIQGDDESKGAAEPGPKPPIDQSAEPPGSVLKRDGTEGASESLAKPSDAATASVAISAAHSGDDAGGTQEDAHGASRKGAATEAAVTIEHKHALAIRWL